MMSDSGIIYSGNSPDLVMVPDGEFYCEHVGDTGMAKEILATLEEYYPAYKWYVQIFGGLVTIKSMRIHHIWSMNVHYSQIAHDAKHRRHEIIMKAGEFLECAGLRRGCATPGEFAQALEGKLDKNAFRPLVEQAK